MIDLKKTLNEVVSSSIQIAAVSNGSFAHVMQIKRYINLSHEAINEIKSNKNLNENLYELLKLTESVTLLVSSVFFSNFAGILHSALEIRSGLADLLAGEKKDGINKISFSLLSLTAQLTMNIHARVALVAVTVLFDLASSIDSFQNERYIEGLASVACALIRVNNNKELFTKYKQIWDKAQVERRVAVDVGSGSTKVIIADVDQNNRIVKVIHQASIPIAYQKDLENSENGNFSSNIQKKGLDSFNQIQRLANEYQADKIYAVATSAFRTSKNGAMFANHITRSTGIPVRIISQFDEGVLAYKSISDSPELQSKDYICWDIGTGSFQITTLEGKDKYAVYMTETGSVPFRSYIDEVMGNDSKDVDINEEALKQADKYARWIGRHALPSIKNGVKAQNGKVIGIGRLFQNSLLPLSDGTEITRKSLRTYIRNSLDKNSPEKKDPFARSDISNAILALGVMKALHIQKVPVIESTSTRGMLTYDDYWNNLA